MSIESETIHDLLSGLTFYRQKRFDGGIRMGVELGHTTILERFEPGEGERDPSLLWYVDVRYDGPNLPTDIESIPQWLLSTRSIIEGGLARFADHLRLVGSDRDQYPLEWSDFPEANDGVTRKIACSAIRRIDARILAEILDDVRIHWSERIEAMIAEQVEYSSQG